jgi:plastocyanin
MIVTAGCGEKRETTTGAGSSGGSAPATSISETEYKLTPASAQAAGSGPITVQVKNAGSTQHALEIEAPSGEVKSKTLSPGASQTLTVNLKPGTYDMYCPIDGHKGKGMVGKLVVGGGGSGGGSGGDSGGGGYSRGGSY